MMPSDRQLELDANWVFRGVLACVAIAPLSTKVAGAAWVFFCGFGLWAALRRSRDGTARDADVRAWLVACLIGLALESIATAIWHDPWDELHAPIRLALAAAATLALVRRASPSEALRDAFAHLLAVAGFAAFALAVWKGADRNSYPTNAIPWSIATTFIVCLLLPRTVDGTRPLPMRLWWLAGSVAGVLAVIQSQTRGAWGVLIWVTVFYAWTVWRQRRMTRHGIGLGIGAAALVAAAGFMLPHVLDSSLKRVSSAVAEFELAAEARRPGEGANSSVGARIYLWQMAARSFMSSPLIGVGGVERKRLIKEEGERMQAPMISELGHAHNQYLHSAMDHGLLGLGAVLTWIVGLGMASRRLGRSDSAAGWQLAGILFMHATGSVTNANFAHTYYGVMLSLCVSLVMLMAKRSPVQGH